MKPSNLLRGYDRYDPCARIVNVKDSTAQTGEEGSRKWFQKQEKEQNNNFRNNTAVMAQSV
jgi:hypothetical protein